jgi:hypothetical protein
MRNLVIVAIIVLAALAALFYLRDRSARGQMESVDREIKRLSTELALARVEIKDRDQTNSTLHAELAARIGHNTALSNRLSTVTGRLQGAEQTVQATEAKVQES